MGWKENEFGFAQEDSIRELLVGRKVVEVDGETLVLDDGTRLEVHANSGCGGCSSGWYEVAELATTENVIMAVNFEETEVKGQWGADTAYQIFVLCEGVSSEQKLLEVTGDDGNGYYGTGYYIRVKKADG